MADRTDAILNLVDALSRSEHHRELFGLAIDTFASLYNADVRLYRHDASGVFVLTDVRRGSAGGPSPAERFSDRLIPASDQVFRLTGLLDIFGSPRGIDTLFAPLGAADESTEWLLVVSAESEPSLEPMLGVVWRAINQRLAVLERDSIDSFRRRLGEILSFGDPSFSTVVRMALEATAAEVGGQSAQLVVYSRHGGAPKLAITFGNDPHERAEAHPLEATETSVNRANVTVRAALGRASIMALEIRQVATDRPGSAERLARATCSELRLWLSGVLLKRSDFSSLVEEEFSAQFVRRLHGSFEDTSPSVPIDGAVVVVLPEVAPRLPSAMADIVDVLQQQLRGMDLVGPIDTEGAWVLLPGAGSDVSSAIVARLSRAARARGTPALKIGVATFGPSQEAPEQLLQRALLNARAAPPM